MITPKFIAKYINIYFYTSCIIFCLLFALSSYLIIAAPEDYQQGVFVKIMYIHVPSAWMAIGIYILIGLSSIGYLIWRNNILDIIAKQSGFIGIGFAIITLITGSLWGKPIWGAWWVWDARLTSMLILFLFYLSYQFLCWSTPDEFQRSDIPAVVAVVGLINIPIVKFSVNLWATLHQPSSFIRRQGIAIDNAILWPLLSTFLCCIFFFIVVLMLRIKTDMYARKLLRIQYMKINK